MASSKKVRRAAPRLPLNRERITQAALALIDEAGLEGFSMRQLGSRLGVEAMALYHHFGAKGEVLDAVMDLLVREVELPPPGSAEPLARLRHTLRSFRGLALSHPHAYPLLVGRRFNSEGAFAFYERVLQIFAELGLAPAEAARWFRTFGYFLSGAGMADIASREQEPDATSLALEHRADSLRAAFPHVAAVAPHLRVDHLQGVFDFGLETLLQALAGTLPPARARKRRPAR